MSGWVTDRAPARTPEQREACYREWIDRQQLEDTPERRSLYMRRYRKPEPPEL